VIGNGVGNTRSIRRGREEGYSIVGGSTRCNFGVQYWVSVITTVAVLVFLFFFGITIIGVVSTSILFLLVAYLVIAFIPPIVYVVMRWL